MYNKYLKPLYHKIIGEEFNYESTEDRLTMQHIVYLCITMGIPINSYGFRYSGKHGPMSMQLYNDLSEINENPDYNPPFNEFDENTMKVIREIRRMIAVGKNTKYSAREWLECLCSLIHLKKFVLSTLNTDTSELFNTLQERQPHLNNKKANEEAYKLIKSL